ncbi:MAG TPA: PIN domain-containing protein [Terriglobales bacterium]|nr:PIN domain-containing protein [Terriglobales bacterium]
MTALVFVDTNVLIYAVDAGDPQKRQAAKTWRDELWKSRRGRISFQVLQEFHSKVSQKVPSAREQARVEVRDLMEWHPVAVDSAILERSWKIQDRYQLSFWDALIVAAAKSAGCQYLLTEDLQTGQDLDGVEVVNPFLTKPESLQAT